MTGQAPTKGFLRNYPLSAMLMWFGRHRSTGRLSITSQGNTRTLYIHHGNLAYAASDYPDDRLGEMLFKRDSISLHQYDDAVRIMKQSGKRLGEVLIEIGAITPPELFDALKEQIVEIVCTLFQLRDGMYDFREGELHKDALSLNIGMATVIYEGVRRITDWSRIRIEMPDMDNILMLSNDPMSLFQDIHLAAEEKEILSLVDGDRTIRDIIDASPHGRFETTKMLYVLWTIGVLTEQFNMQMSELTVDEILAPVDDRREEFVARVSAIHGVLDTLTDHKLLAVDDTADFETITRQYYKLSKEFHPDRGADLDSQTRDMMADIFDAIANAYDRLKRRQLTRKYAEGDEDLAMALLKAARDEMARGNNRDAARFLEEAVSANPDNAECWDLLAQSLRHVHGRLGRAEEAANYALGLQPDNSNFLVTLGQIKVDAGQKDEAKEIFERAYALDPSNLKAREAVFWFKASEGKGN